MIPGRKPLLCVAAMVTAALGASAGTPRCMADENEPDTVQATVPLLAYTRGRAANSPNSRIRLKAELD
ncbi:MAG TPA: hypothetical protein VMY37_25960 [Thermoguttaceae bacterium]|nr:hypothetical protein [Thermoguttaceae bacterium]